MYQVLVLSSKDDVHEHEGEGKRPDKILQRPFQLAATAENTCLESSRFADFIYQGIQRLDTIRQCVTLLNVGSNRNHSLPIEPIDAGRGYASLERNHIVDSRELWRGCRGRLIFSPRCGTWAGSDIKLRNRLNIATVEANQPQLNVVGVIDGCVAIARDAVVAAHSNAQSIGDFGGYP